MQTLRAPLTALFLVPALLGACVQEDDLESELSLDAAEFDVDDEDSGSELELALELEAGEAQLPGEASNLSIQCGPVGYWYQNPAPTPWYDLANCYVASLPEGVQPFVYANNWYVQPGPGNSCAIGWYDLANCYIGSAPVGSQAFIYDNNLYFTPIPVEGIPVGTRPNCVSPWGPGPQANCESEAEAEALDYATAPNGTSNYTWMWGDPCPVGTSVVVGSQFYVPGSCTIDNASPVCGPEYRYARYKIGALCV